MSITNGEEIVSAINLTKTWCFGLLTSINVAGLLYVTPTLANSQAHVHGMGEAYIVEENSQWQFEIKIPSIDLLGFESNANSYEQLAKVESVTTQLLESDNIIRLPNFCKVESVNNNISHLKKELKFSHDHSEGQADSHSEIIGHNDKLQHSVSHSEHKEHNHSHDNEEQSTHNDILITILATCERKVDNVEISVFKVAQSLESLSTQWIVGGRQGFVKVTPNTNVVEF